MAITTSCFEGRFGSARGSVEKPRFSAVVRAGTSGLGRQRHAGVGISGREAVISLSGPIPVPHRRGYSAGDTVALGTLREPRAIANLTSRVIAFDSAFAPLVRPVEGHGCSR